jgi:hypothetical protein
MAQKPKGEGAPGIEAVTKAKVVIPDWAGRILILTRSPRESTRPGKPDLPGGSMDTTDAARDGRGRVRSDRFDLIRTIEREGTMEEMPGAALGNIRFLDAKAVPKVEEDGTINVKTSVVLAATAEFPAGGIVLGDQGDHGFEHVGAEWLMPEEAVELDGLPKKYRRAIAASGPVISGLAELQRDRAGEPPTPLSAQTIRELGASGLLMGQETSLPQGDQAFVPILQPATA